MVSLLDANLLIALFDASHVHHQRFAVHRAEGWATCSLTQNAAIRVISQPAYPNRLPVADIARRLRAAVSASDHQFWMDDVSLTDASLFDLSQVLTPRHLTDIYLLGLAAKRDGRLVTLDKGIPAAAVLMAGSNHLLTL